MDVWGFDLSPVLFPSGVALLSSACRAFSVKGAHGTESALDPGPRPVVGGGSGPGAGRRAGTSGDGCSFPPGPVPLSKAQMRCTHRSSSPGSRMGKSRPLPCAQREGGAHAADEGAERGCKPQTRARGPRASHAVMTRMVLSASPSPWSHTPDTGPVSFPRQWWGMGLVAGKAVVPPTWLQLQTQARSHPVPGACTGPSPGGRLSPNGRGTVQL